MIDQILLQALNTREYAVEGWSNQDYYASLPKIQRIWLDKVHQKEREENSDWRDELSREVARWILRSYEKVISDAYTLGTGELLDVKQWVENSLQKAKEFLMRHFLLIPHLKLHNANAMSSPYTIDFLQ